MPVNQSKLDSIRATGWYHKNVALAMKWKLPAIGPGRLERLNVLHRISQSQQGFKDGYTQPYGSLW